KVVASAVWFHCTTELETKLAPERVNFKSGPPAVALTGETQMMRGTGLRCGAAEVMVNGSALERPPPGCGFATVTETVPAAAMSLAEMAAVSWVLLIKVVGRAAPFHCTTAPA